MSEKKPGYDGNIDDAIADLARETQGGADINDLLRCVIREFGGNAEIARLLKLAFDENNPGSSNQVRILSDIFTLIGKQSGEADGDAEDDLVDLEAEAKRLMFDDAPDD